MKAAETGERAPAKIARAVVAATIAGLFLGLLGPFGSYFNGGPENRIVYWIVSMWFGCGFYGAAVVAIVPLARRSGIAPWIVTAFLVIVASAPQAIATRALALWFWPELARVPIGPLAWYLEVLVVALPLVFGYAAWLGVLGRSLPSPALPADESDGAPSLFALLPPHLGQDILCMAMEDHYVRVHTPLGSELLLMPMARAVPAVASIEGMRVHRSWWVARSAVTRIDGSARSMRLHLSNGVAVPIARRMVAELRAAGWLAAEQ
jgi:LytTr DNA-binding domain